ncbi:ABC transporter substrate-binding protein [Bradyrhizobium sp. WSM1253]|uniref:ABC transporter substrate-binding protein n=1 Tax=Bradyrhizobium sp. WSM1253 TaxID=319003 RepID=UPI00025D171E|nr:ABC transporter substrate-binding protein [Bradyrhizobium sp. WSM1253]EIG57807.1 ABC-type nitrate/sulfonate/bicarbonate transport system, periplasmic component [Bradyrhizobium sp. WSM1253]
MTLNGSTSNRVGISRRTVLSVGTGFASASAGFGGASRALAADPAPSQLTVAVIGDGRTGVWASLRAGVGGRNLEQELGTKIVWQPGFTASLPVMEAIKAGSVDFTFATATAVVNAVPARVPIVPLAAYPLPADEVDFLVQANSSIKTAADLKGKKIAHQNGTTGTYSLIKYLETAGLRLSDVQAVSLSGADAFTAFAQGSIDGWIHWQPATALALTKLGGKSRLLPDVKTYDYAFYVARSDVALEYPQLFAKFVKIIRETQAYIFAHPAESVALWASQGGFPPNGTEQAVYEKLVRDARLSESTAVALKPIDDAAAASAQDLADNFHALGVLPNKVDDHSCSAPSSTRRRRPLRWSSARKRPHENTRETS